MIQLGFDPGTHKCAARTRILGPLTGKTGDAPTPPYLYIMTPIMVND